MSSSLSGATADKLSLYLVAAGGDEEPTVEAISAVLSSGLRLGVDWSLSRAKISSEPAGTTPTCVLPCQPAWYQCGKQCY